MIIRNGLIHDAINEDAYISDILVQNGKITKIGKNIEASGEEVIDADGHHVYPGLVEAHAHIGLNNYGSSPKYGDINEKNDIICPHLRAIDGFYPFNPILKNAVRGGVTTIGVGPGSANIIGGTFMAVKTVGTCVDDMVVKNPVAMKCAFGENPKSAYENKSDNSRLTTAAKFREFLYQCREYLEKKEAAGDDTGKKPSYNAKYEAMIPVLKKEIPLKAHAHRADDICTAIRIAKEFDLKLTLEHCTEGHMIVEELKRANVPLAVGPSMCNRSKAELSNMIFETPGILSNAGLDVSVTTDCPVTQPEYITLAAGLAIKHGMKPFKALQAITINPAKHLGIEDRVGSLEVGKDGDILITDGDILVNTTRILKVVMDGKIVVE